MSGAIREVPFYIGRGNFRPLGRMLDYAEHSFSFEFASIVGIELPLAHGLFRLFAIVLLGIAGLVSLFYLRNAARLGGRRQIEPVLTLSLYLYPLAFATSVIAAGDGSPFTLFPFLYLVSTTLALSAGVVVARDSNLVVGRLSFFELLGYAVLGAVLASTFDLAYLGAPLMVAFVLTRLLLARLPIRNVISMRLSKAIAATAVGFAGVFIPTRLLIQRACSGGSCYAASDLSIDPAGWQVLADRLVSGFPVAGWSFVNERVGLDDPNWGVFFTNAGATVLLVAGLLYVYSAWRQTAPLRKTRTSDEEADEGRSFGGKGAGILITMIWPLSVVAAGALIAALSAKMQAAPPGIGSGWRDSGFAAVGWALALSVLLAAGILLFDSPRARSGLLIVSLALLAAGMGQTFLANANLAESRASNAEAVINTRIAFEVIDFDMTELGNDRRCGLLADFSSFFHDRQLPRDEQLARALNQVSLQRYGVRFCDRDVLGARS